jgi:hypothetical protein
MQSLSCISIECAIYEESYFAADGLDGALTRCDLPAPVWITLNQDCLSVRKDG